MLSRLINDLRRLYNGEKLDAVVIDGRPRLVSGWELLEDGPTWVLDLKVLHQPQERWFHPGETLEVVTPHDTTLIGQLVACRTSGGGQRLVLKGHGSTYVETE